MNYKETLNKLLKPHSEGSVKVLDLFAGCGGLSLGFEAFGFITVGFEMNEDASSTYRKNLFGICHNTKLSTDFIFPKADVIIGGPPCQPFSVIGSQTGKSDSRNGFPVFLEAIKQVRPKVFLLENVVGLVSSNSSYFLSLIEELKGIGYIIDAHILNAVNYGVPQNRQRLIIIGHKSRFDLPVANLKKVTVEEAIGDLMYQVRDDSKFLTKSMDQYIAKYEKASSCTTPRDLHPSRPARTLTCKNLSGATGDMHRILLKDGRRRRLTVREAARLQSFPDWYSFTGSEASAFVQIGNAVPPLLAYHIAVEVYNTFKRKAKSKSEIKKINFNETIDHSLISKIKKKIS